MAKSYEIKEKQSKLFGNALSLFIFAVILLPVAWISGWFSSTVQTIMLSLIGVLTILGVSMLIYKDYLNVQLKAAEENEREEVIEAKKKREEKKSFLRRKFKQIPLREIKISNDKPKNLKVSDIKDLKFSMPNGNKKTLYGNFTVIDLETTGIKATEKIIEVAAIKYRNFKPIEAFTTLLNPGKTIPLEATMVNNIRDYMVEGKPEYKQIINSLDEFVGGDNLLGQNLMFDLKYLYRYGYEFTKYNRKYFDTLEMAKNKLVKYNERKEEKDPDFYWDVEDYKLGTLCDYYDIELLDAHRAMGDCYATAQVFEAMLIREYQME